MNRILFFLPFWWDHVYSGFDPWTDRWTSDSEHYKFLWELNDKVPFDGVIFSRVRVEASQSKLRKIEEAGGIRNYLRIPGGYSLFGDCGAFGYIEDEKPPYDPLETLEFYERMQYNLACTVDHLIVKATEEQKYRRLEITLKNAEEMMSRWSSGNYSYELIGVAQGWNPQSYRDSVKQLLDMNFKYVALGGLVRSRTPEIIRVLRACYPLWRNKAIKVHVFGVARWNLFPAYKRYRITSFDNAYHRRAWLSSKNNYELNENGYTAIRVPLTHPRSKKRIPEEQRVFDVLKLYCEGKAKPEDVIKALKSYEEKLVVLGLEKENRFARLKGLEQDYLRTLNERPWEKCTCSICSNFGVHVCVFRTNERNMRRGFHNLYQLYRRFQLWQEGKLKLEGHNFLQPRMIKEIPIKELKGKKVLVITSCTAEKLGNTSETIAKAKEMYKGRMFKLTRRLCERMNWDYVIISAKYGLLFPDEEITGYEKFLRTKGDIEEIKPKVLPKLSTILPKYDKFLVIAGQTYREVIKSLMDRRFLTLQSKGYGDLCSKISDALSNTDAKLSNYF